MVILLFHKHLQKQYKILYPYQNLFVDTEIILLSKEDFCMSSINIYPLNEQNHSDITAALSLFNRHCEQELPYKPLTSDNFISLFCKSDNRTEKYVLLAQESENFIGFVAGCQNKESKDCYITFI